MQRGNMLKSCSACRVFRKWTYVTQVQQAITYETAIGVWRQLKGTAAHTMGVLYWQLNDVWLVTPPSCFDMQDCSLRLGCAFVRCARISRPCKHWRLCVAH